MLRSHLLLVGELTKALYFSTSPSSLSVSSTNVSAAAAVTIPSMNAVAKSKHTGKIVEWDPFERHGVIADAAGHRYRIASTRAFETVLPTMLRTLEGAVVEFDVDRQPRADRVIIRNRLAHITEESYRQKPPVNFLSAEMLGHLKPATQAETKTASAEQQEGGKGSLSSTHTLTNDSPVKEKATLYAKNITVDIRSIPAKQIARWSGPLSEEEVIKPTKNLKDMRSSRLFDRETNAFLKLKQQLGSAKEAKRVLARQREQSEASAAHRAVVAEKVTGVILAWSSIHRSGLIHEESEAKAEKLSPANAAATTAFTVTAGDNSSDATHPVCIIRNVHSFKSALPTSQSLLQRYVTFTKVTYSTQPNRFFAENIEVVGDVTYDNIVSSLEEAHAAKQKERAAFLRSGRAGALIFKDEEVGDKNGGGRNCAESVDGASDSRNTGDSAGHFVGNDKEATEDSRFGKVGETKKKPADPSKVYYGVIVRWSGGQGVVEGGDGHHYYLRSAADFVQLVDQDSHQLRGAVVQFKRNAVKPRYACEVDILSTATTTPSEVKPMLQRMKSAARWTTTPSGVADNGTAAPTLTVKSNTSDVEPEGVEWIYGTVLSWSAVEGQGIVLSDVDKEVRYVLRDPEENVIAYAAKHRLLRKGRQVKFLTFGSTGRLVCNLVLLDTEVEEEALREEELRPKEPELTLDGNMNEAIPSPMSTSYWLNRMDRAGYDTTEVKNRQNRALTLDEDKDDDGTEGGKFLDSEELLMKDPWWSDPRKNIRFPNSDMTAGHLALIGPASMMNVAMKTRDPNKLDKMVKKYQSRLSEEQKEYAWKQAKEMAPKYEECIRKGRERNEEPKFYFF